MKRLFSVFMLAAIATLTFAFTTPKEDNKAAFTTFYHFDKASGQWQSEGAPDDCDGGSVYCEINFPDQYASEINSILSQLGTTPPAGNPAVIPVTLSTGSVNINVVYQP